MRKWQELAVGISGFVEAERTRRPSIVCSWFVVNLICIYYHFMFLTTISSVKSWVIFWFDLICWTWGKESGGGPWWGGGEYIVLWGEVSATLAGGRKHQPSLGRSWTLLQPEGLGESRDQSMWVHQPHWFHHILRAPADFAVDLPILSTEPSLERCPLVNKSWSSSWSSVLLVLPPMKALWSSHFALN